MWREKAIGVNCGFLSALVLLISLCGSIAKAQLATVYVDALNGSDSFSGENPADTPHGSGPKSTIHAGLSVLADGGRLVLFAGVYAGDGVDTDGSTTNPSDNADINISLTKYPQLTKGLIIELRSLGGSNEIRIVNESNTLRAPNGALISHDANQYIPNFLLNIPGATLTVVTTNGTEYLSLAGRHSSGSPVAGLYLLAGTFDIARGSSFRLLNASTISISGPARFLREAPQKESDLNLTYLGSGTFSAGAEASYPSFGAGTLTVAKDSGTTITFPYPTAFSGNNDAIRIQSGNAVFSGSITLGSAGGASANPRTADLVVSTNGLVTFRAPVGLTVVNGASHDSSISTINNEGSGTVSFRESVTWYAAATASDKSFPASETTAVVWNAGNGSMVFDAGIVLSHAFASGFAPATVEVSVQNDGSGSIKFGGPVQVISRASTSPVGVQRFSLAVSNVGGGTLDISGTIGSRLVNARNGTRFGSVNIIGPTTVGQTGMAGGALINAEGCLINLGSNTLTLRGTTNHLVDGSTFAWTSGQIVVNSPAGVTFDGGAMPRFVLDQPAGGSTRFIGAVALPELVVSSGSCLVQTSLSVSGRMELNGGSLTVENRVGAMIIAGSYHQSAGLMNLGGNIGGELRIQGDFTRSSGLFIAGAAATLVMAGNSSQTINPGSSLQLASLTIDNPGGIVRCAESFRVSGDLLIASGSRLDVSTSTILLNGETAAFTNNGSFDATGLGIVLGGTNSLPGGASLVGSEIRSGPGSRFSSFTIDIGVGNSCMLKGTADVTWTGSMALLSGNLEIASSIDLSPSGTDAKMTLDVVRSEGIIQRHGSFNKSRAHLTLCLIGVLRHEFTLPVELVNQLANVDTLQIDAHSDTEIADGNISTGELGFFQFPPSGVQFNGSLAVGPFAAVRLAGDGKAGNSLELTGSTSHRIRGILTTADSGDVILISGEKVTVTGGNTPSEIASLGSVAIRSTSSCKISAIRSFLGSVTTLSRSTVSISMGSLPVDQIIAGTLIINGNYLGLGSDIEVKNGVQFGAGILDFGPYNLQLTSSGGFVQSPDVGGFRTSGGYLVMNRPSATLKIVNKEEIGLPNLQILANTYLEGPGRVTRSLTIGSKESPGMPTLFLGQTGSDLIFSGSVISLLSNGSGNRDAVVSNGKTDGTPGGRLFIIGTSVTMILNGDCTIEEIVYNPPAIDGTLSILSTDLMPHVLTISDILTHAGGQIGLGFNHLSLAGTGSTAGASSYNRSDGTIGASTGELRFTSKDGPQRFFSGIGFSVPNLRIWNPHGVTKNPGSPPMIVTNMLDLSDGALSFDSGTLIVEDNASIVRRKSSARVTNPLSFRSVANIYYLLDMKNGNLRTEQELPSVSTRVGTLRIYNPHGSPDSSSVILSSDIEVRDAILLEAGSLDISSAHLSLLSGGTIDIKGGHIRGKIGEPSSLNLSRYNLIYRTSAIIAPLSQEFQSGQNISVASLSIVGADTRKPTIVRLDANRTVENLFIDAPQGGIEFGAPGSFVAKSLTIRDSVNIRHGSFSNTSGTNAIVNLAGRARQFIALPDSGLTLQGGASAVHLQLNNPEGFLVQYGDLNLSPGSIVFFVNGVLDMGSNSIQLSRTVTSQGFDRQGVRGSNASHVIGRVRHSITGGAGDPVVYPDGRYEFPTGTASHYRPLTLAFTSEYPAKNPGTIEVAHIDLSPTGAAGLPLDGGLGVRIGGVAQYHWSLTSSPESFSDGQKLDIQTSIEAPGFQFLNAADLRLILRKDGSPGASAWNLLGSAGGYGSNSVNVTPRGDTVLSVRVQAANPMLPGKALLAIGIPLDRRPYLNFRVPSSISQVGFNVPAVFKVSITDPDRKGVTILWKVNGVTMKAGSDTAFTYSFQSAPLAQSVRAVFLNTDGLSDSTEWNFTVVDVANAGSDVPADFVLAQNYPNPFNPETAISYQVPSGSYVTLKIYDALGKEVTVLVDGYRFRGTYTVPWKAASMPSGIYLCRLIATSSPEKGKGPYVATRKMALTK